jgi:nitrogen fixation-related uncharacterized protein
MASQATRNLLAREGWKLRHGQIGDLTRAQWLLLYDQVEDELEGAQAKIIAEHAEIIRKLEEKAQKKQKST